MEGASTSEPPGSPSRVSFCLLRKKEERPMPDSLSGLLAVFIEGNFREKPGM
jgi:hypothetical protein